MEYLGNKELLKLPKTAFLASSAIPLDMHINIREWGLFECSLLLVWRAHVFRFPLFHHVVVETR